MNKFALLLFLASTQLIGQTKPENNISPYARLYEPRYLNDWRAEPIARFVTSVSPGVRIQWEPIVKGFTITSGAGIVAGSETVDKAEALLKRFDVPVPPERQIEMTIYLVRAIGDANRARQASMPPELAPVEKEMKGALSYAGFELANTMQMIIRDGLKLEDALPASATNMGGISYFYSLEFHDPSISTDGKTITIQHFRFAVKVPVNMNNAGQGYQDVSIATPVTIHQDQKQVLGKIKLDSMSKDDLFVVLSYKLK